MYHHQPHTAIQPLLRAAPGAEDGDSEVGKVWATVEEDGEPRTAVTSRRRCFHREYSARSLYAICS